MTQTPDQTRATRSVWQRFIAAIEPWYNWGTIWVERMEGMHMDGERLVGNGDGSVRFFELQWFGVHVQVQLGRTPKAGR